MLDGAGGMVPVRCRSTGAVGFLIDSRVPVNHLLGFSGGGGMVDTGAYPSIFTHVDRSYRV